MSELRNRLKEATLSEIEAELEATQRLVQAAHNWQEEGFTHWALTPAVEGYKNATEKGDTEILSWKARAEQNYAEWEAANKLLEQTIEVLEGFDWTWLKHEPEWAEGFEWLKDRMDPLLDNLKALKKEAGS